MKKYKRIFTIVLDSLGIGEMTDSKDYGDADVPLCDSIILKAKMNEIERFIRSLPVCREQTLLYNHYVRGHSIDFCGEMMYVSRRTAYRIAKKAIEIAAEYYSE